LVTGKTVSLAASTGSHAVITPASGVPSVTTGAVVFTVTDATVENVTFAARDISDGVTLGASVAVNFVGPPPATARIARAPNVLPADGRSATTITVTLQDAQGHGTPAKLITLSQGSGHSLVSGPSPSVTDSNGQVRFTATNQVGEVVTYMATDVTDGLL